MRLIFGALLVIGAAVVPRTARAQWGVLSDTRELVGKVVVDVGSLSRQSRYGDQRVDWLEFRGAMRTVCFDDARIGRSSLGAMLLMDDAKHLYLATYDCTIGDIDVTVRPVTPRRCS
jgi:hypothetical protein